MEKVLVVEDSRLVCQLLKKSIEDSLSIPVVIAHDLATAREILETGRNSFFLALLDLGLPDAPKGEIVDLVKSYGIPMVVFTSALADDARNLVMQKGVVDYVYKHNQTDVDYILRLVKRMHRNPGIEVLVVDDSPVTRQLLRRLLELQRLKVIESGGGEEAVAILKENRNIKLALIDFRMPEMDGNEMIGRIRAFRGRDQLAIIGMSAHGKGSLSAKLLKSGANDFLRKPFVNEEFQCRVMQNLETIEHIAEIREASLRDCLTGLCNRGFFFRVGSRFHEIARRRDTGMVVAMIDGDYFKRINDTYGHRAGDMVLKHLAALLKKNLRGGDIVARYGGEEFGVVASHVDGDKIHETFDRLRQTVQDTPCETDGETIFLTVSIGIAVELGSNFEEMVDRADKMLYLAKEAGRNQVVVEKPRTAWLAAMTRSNQRVGPADS
ncbi:MAG: diguanylate cyclase [Acidobacteriota bacterium]|nr:diguanylate cyclase [Acidobacteriota bacterium]